MPASADIERLYRTHGHVVLRRARAILGNNADAREVLQDVFAALVGHPEQLRDVASPVAWLYSATTHRCLNLLRNSKNRLRLLQSKAEAPPETRSNNPETTVVARDYLASLDDDTAQAAIYYYIDEMSQAEVAELLGCSRRHVGNLLQRLKGGTGRGGSGAMLIEGSREGRGEDCLSDLQLDQLRLRELTEDAAASARAHVAGCDRCRAREARLEALAADLDAELPPLDAKPRGRGVAVAVVLLLAAAAALLWWRGTATPDGPEVSPDPPAPLVAVGRLKGGVALGMFVRRDGRVRAWAAGELVREGDVLAFTYSSEEDRTLAVFDVEGRSATLLFPTEGETTAAIAAGRDVAIDAAAELDASLEPERIVGVFCDAPVATAALAEALRSAAPEAVLPAGCVAVTLELEKMGRR